MQEHGPWGLGHRASVSYVGAVCAGRGGAPIRFWLGMTGPSVDTLNLADPTLVSLWFCVSMFMCP